jgi:hypothetical protein
LKNSVRAAWQGDRLNDAWIDFWRDPQGYAAREKDLVEELRTRCSIS